MIEDDDTRIIPVVSTAGERGKKGDTGDRGLTGQAGLDGKAPAVLTRPQGLALFFIIVLIGVVISWLGTAQANKIEAQQLEIAVNSQRISEAQHETCLSSVLMLARFNAQQTALAEIEKTQTANPALAKARIKAYTDARVLPLPTCTR